MVKGISKQVIVLHAPEEKLFEQAIFILNEGVVAKGGVTDDALMKEARKLISGTARKKNKLWLYGPVWALGGALMMGVLWLATALM